MNGMAPMLCPLPAFVFARSMRLLLGLHPQLGGSVYLCLNSLRMLKIDHFTFNPFAENTYVLSHPNGACLLLDPGCQSAQEEQALLDFFAERNLQPDAVLLTHAHLDHVFGVQFLHRQFKLPIYAHPLSKGMIERLPQICQMYGLPPAQCPMPSHWLNPEAGFDWQGEHFDLPHLPGHSPDHVALIHPDQGFAFSGDVLFRDSIGRSDLPGGNQEQLMESIGQLLNAYPDSMQVYPGHGPSTTLGRERKLNPYLSGRIS